MIGPTLPPHLQPKAKAGEDKAEDTNTAEDSQKSTSPPPKPSSIGPQLPPHLLAAREAKRKRKREESEDTIPHTPSPPSKRHTESKVALQPVDDSDSDTEVGPSLAAMMTPAESVEHARKEAIARLSRISPQPNSTTAPEEPKLQRDSWMLAPPTRADWLGTLDASKLKGRTFNQSKSSNTAKSTDHTLWTETPLERAQRLEDEALGRKTKHSKEEVVQDEEPTPEEVERERRIKEYNAQTRGPSLMEKHAAKKKNEGEVDDPSKRGFDYQKDIAGGSIGFKERSAMIGRAKDLDSKYSRGSYL